MSLKESKVELDRLISNKDYEGYLAWRGVDINNLVEKDFELLNFECMIKEQSKEFYTPESMLEFKILKMFNIAKKHSISLDGII